MDLKQIRVQETFKLILIILWLASIFSFGLILFTKGFFLTRIELSNHTDSTKRISPFGKYWSEEFLKKRFREGNQEISTMTYNDVPWKSFEKAILLIIDGLRYDFVSKTTSDTETYIYENNMLFLQQLIENEKKRARLFKFIADPPTTTMQRLKALTTGSLPTFIDASANFASSAILEDNLLFQLKANNKSIVFMGDDTWLDLYPNYFERQFPYPSFDVMDLDTVDNGVIHQLIPELKKNDWHVIIGHFLGVDHCGHRYGPNHPEMKRKLLEMDVIIKDVINNLDNDTLLYVFGDHGMTQHGDHGGDSENETTAALFVYSKKDIFLDVEGQHHLTTAVSQVSIVPTLAIQLNIPIPFSNIGIIIEDFFFADSIVMRPTKHYSVESKKEIRDNLSVLSALYQNALQVYDYLVQYSELSNDIPSITLESLKKKYVESERKLFNLFYGHLNGSLADEDPMDYNSKDFLAQIVANQDNFRYFIRSVFGTCFEVWAKFDMPLIVIGKLIMALSSISPYFLKGMVPLSEINMWSQDVDNYLNTVTWIEIVGFILNLTSWSILAVSHPMKFDLVLICTTFQITSLFCLLSHNKPFNMISSLMHFKPVKFIVLFPFLIVIIYTGFLFSNSFVIMESSLLLFLIQTLLITWLLWQLNEYIVPIVIKDTGNKKRKNEIESKCRYMRHFMVLCGCICMRISTLFWSCREEQSGCKVTFFLRSLDSVLFLNESVKTRQFLSIGSILIIVIAFYYWCKKHGNLIGISALSVSARLLFPICGLILILHWTLQVPSKNKLVDVIDVQWVQQTVLPRCAYAMLLLSLVMLLWNPLSAHIVFRQSESIREKLMENELHLNIQILFKDLRNRLDSNDEEQKQKEFNQAPYAFGLHRIYSTSYLGIMTALLLLIILLLGDGLSFSVILIIVITMSLLIAKKYGSKRCKETTQLVAVLWSLLASYWFYGTGHQATIPSIRFDAAFIGLQGESSNHMLRAMLILINTFSSHLFFGMALPLLHICCATSQMETDDHLSNKNDVEGELVLQKNSLQSNGLLMETLLSYFALRMFQVTAMAFVASLHRRHLMVWKIFGPRFVFEAASFLFSFPFIMIGCLYYFRVDKTLRRWLMQLEDRCNAEQ